MVKHHVARDFNPNQDRDDNGRWVGGGEAVHVVTETTDDGNVKVLGVYGDEDDAHAAAFDHISLDEDGDHIDEDGNAADVEVHSISTVGDHDGQVDVVSRHDDDGTQVYGVFANGKDAFAAKDQLLKEKWASDGPDLDYDSVEDEWQSEVAEWNESHPNAQIDPDNYKFGTQPEFEQMFDAKYLAGNKEPYPGVKKANRYFEEQDGSHVQIAKKKRVTAKSGE